MKLHPLSSPTRNGNWIDTDGLRFVGKIAGVLVLALIVANITMADVRTVLDTARQTIKRVDSSQTAAALSPKDAVEKSAEAEERAENAKIALEDSPAPHTSARSYLVADLDTNEIYLKKASSRTLPIASLTKLMTAVIAHENISYGSSIHVSEKAVETHGRQGKLQAGETYQLATLLYPLLLESSNDAAAALAQHHGRRAFLRSMNQKADALNMRNTHFDDASGLSERNISTAGDLLKLADHIYEEKYFIFDITTELQKEVGISGSVKLRNYTNNNPFKTADHFIGGKNGYTNIARKTLLSLFRVPFANGRSHTIAIIVLGSEQHKKDTERLLGWFTRAAGTSLADNSQ